MSNSVDDPWTHDVDVTELSVVDLESSRMASTKVSDASRELHRLIETLRQHEELSSWSETADRALRVELAYAIDSFEVSFDREDYAVAYTIPPVGWVDDQQFESVELVPEDDVESDDRWISFSTPRVVLEMAKDARDEGVYETITEIVWKGTERLLGRTQ